MVKLCGFLLLPILAFAQLTPNSVTVTATRSVSSKPDTVRLNVSISAPTSASLDDVVAAGASAGVTAASFTSLTSYSTNGQMPVQWTFLTTAPLSELKARIGVLTALQTSLAKDKKFDLSFYVAGTDPSSQACAMADLVADARAQAAKLASAAGMSVGAVQAISGATSGGVVPGAGISGASTNLSPSCSITVKFALTGGF